MVEKFNKELIIYYSRNRFVNIRKRVINKIYHNRYEVETYYRVNKIDKCFKSRYIFNEKQIEMLINVYLEEYNIEKTIVYK